MTSLLELYNIHLPSKYRSFIPIYDKWFTPIRETAKSVLEIGFQYGRCLRMFRDYFTSANIYGIDINNRYESDDKNRITLIDGDATADSIVSRLSEFGQFDVIIDDGSHYPETTILTFEKWFPLVKQGGLYIIEDLGVSYWLGYGGSFRNRLAQTRITTMEYLKELTDSVNSDCWHSEVKTEWGQETINHPARLQDNVGMSHTYFDIHVSAVHFYPMLSVIEKA